jgi:hypothetical protein
MALIGMEKEARSVSIRTGASKAAAVINVVLGTTRWRNALSLPPTGRFRRIITHMADL